MVGRVVLIQSSSATIPDYVMLSNLLPCKILDGIDWVNRNFLWGSTDQARKMHWVKWDNVTKPKNLGGLGLQTAKGRNTTLLAKLNWRLHLEDNAPWSRVLKLKYGTRQRINSKHPARLPCSPTWKGMRKGEEVFKKGVKWIPGHNSNLNFWHDYWSDLGPIRNIIQGPLPVKQMSLRSGIYALSMAGIGP